MGARNQPLTEEQRAEADALVQELSDAKARASSDVFGISRGSVLGMFSSSFFFFWGGGGCAYTK